MINKICTIVTNLLCKLYTEGVMKLKFENKKCLWLKYLAWLIKEMHLFLENNLIFENKKEDLQRVNVS